VANKVLAYAPAKRGVISASLRFDTLAKCSFRCHYCGERPGAGDYLVVDHVVPVAVGGLTIASNLVAACRPCNDGKSSKVVEAPPVPESLSLVAHGLGRKPLGGTGEKTVTVPMRWAPSMLARIDEARGETDRSSFIREAVETLLAKRENP
jgi:hypothetical protein